MHDLLVGEEKREGVLPVESIEEVEDGYASGFVELVGLDHWPVFEARDIFVVDLVA
jgi:hypothetical protein